MAETKINANQTSITASDLGAIQNTATGTNALTVLGTATSQDDAINIGVGSVASSYSTVIGYNANASSSDVIIGRATRGNGQDVSIGLSAESRSINNVTVGFAAISYAIDSISIGAYAQATAANSVMINTSGDTANNNVAGTFNFANTNGNYQIVSADGTIPADRLKNAVNKYSTMPTASASNEGWIVQFTGTTDSTYTHGYLYECVSDGQDPATYSWTEVQVQAGGGSSLPSQTGNAGKFLTTDGTDASWATINALQNTATGTDSLTILGTASSLQDSINIGVGSTSGRDCVIIGHNAKRGDYSGSYGVAIGSNTKISTNTGYEVAVGNRAQCAASHAIQLGSTGSATTNSDSNTFKVANANGNYEIMSADGTIPADRLKNAINKYSTMPTAASTNEGWIIQYTGTTDSTYTHGYIYECTTDGSTYSWTQTNVQPAGGGSSLPSQTGNAGKFLTTDGTDASWSDKPLANQSTGQNSIKIGGGIYSAAKQNAITIGNNTQDGADSITIGTGARVFGSGTGNVVIGSYGYIGGNNYCIAIGDSAKTGANNTIQLNASGSNQTNSDANTFKVANANGNYELLSANGTIPTDRYTTTPSADGTYVPTLTIASGVATRTWAAPGGGGATSATATLAVNDWSSNTQTVNVTGVTATNVVFVSPAPASAADYASAGIICTSQGSGTLTFTCTTTPTNAITVNVVILG